MSLSWCVWVRGLVPGSCCAMPCLSTWASSRRGSRLATHKARGLTKHGLNLASRLVDQVRCPLTHMMASAAPQVQQQQVNLRHQGGGASQTHQLGSGSLAKQTADRGRSPSQFQDPFLRCCTEIVCAGGLLVTSLSTPHSTSCGYIYAQT